MDIGNKIKQIRKDKNLTLRSLAKLAHISHSFIADIESGRSKPSLNTVESLAKALNVPLSVLVDDNDLTYKETINQPSVQELEEFLKQSNVQFDGAPLDDEDKEDILNFLRMVWKRKKRK